eukprot:XP_001698191.1 predicted protein [Chlamydomonas reinhardtii]
MSPGRPALDSTAAMNPAQAHAMKITADDETAKKLGSAAMAAARLSMSVGGLSPGRQRRRTSGVSLPMPWESATKSAAQVDMAAAGPSSIRRHTLRTASTDEDEDNAGQYTAGSKGYGAGYGASYGVGAFNYDRYHDGDSQLVSDQRVGGQQRSLSSLMRGELEQVAAALPGGSHTAPSPAASASRGDLRTGHTTTSFPARPTNRKPSGSASKPTPSSPTAGAASPAATKPPGSADRSESPLFIICRRDWRAEMEEATGMRKGAVGSRSPNLLPPDDESLSPNRRKSPKPVAPGPSTMRAPSNWRTAAEGEMGYHSIFSSPGSAQKKSSPSSLQQQQAQVRSSSAAGADNRSPSCKMTAEERAARDRRLQGWRDRV